MGRQARPGRRLNPVSKPESPAGRFALELRALRADAGTPSFRTLSALTVSLGEGYSDTTLSNAASGRELPTLGVAVMFVRACAAYARAHPEQAVGSAEAWEEAALLEQWRQRWYEARNEQAATQQSPTSVGADPEPGYATTAFATGTLPAEVTSFVGRKTDLAAVEERLAHGGTVTLVGTGGVGKTRLALHVARRVCDRYRDGVGLVELASVTDPQAVVWTVGAALRIPDGSADASADTLAAALADRELLLLLDNCEHLVESCAVLVETLRRRAPACRSWPPADARWAVQGSSSGRCTPCPCLGPPPRWST